jgi:hypothetical protein
VTTKSKFHSELRYTADPALKAALLASSFASSRPRRGPFAPGVSGISGEALPLSAVPSLIQQHQGKPGYDYVSSCFHRGVDRTRRERGGPPSEPLEGVLRAPDAPASGDRAVSLPEHTMEPDIEYDPETSITTISVWSRFEDISAKEADTILDLSRPYNWAEAVPTFFVASDPGTFDVRTGKFIRAARVPANVSRERRYQLREYVEWAWTPSTQGGIVNVLDIHESAPNDAALDAVCERVQYETKTGPVERNGTPSRRRGVSYTYALNRCLQSKFVSNWEAGGLDVDEGHFTATWDSSSKTLLIEAVKEIRYSRQADIVPGFSSLLNLLAPAVTSMLMKHLAYEGVVHYLECQRKRARRAPVPPAAISRKKAS